MIRSIYLYMVSLVTLIMSITGGTMLFNSVADFVAPYTYTMSYEDYKQNETSMGNPTLPMESEDFQEREESIKASYDMYVEETDASEQKRALNSLIGSLGLILIPLPIFLLFQRKISREKTSLKTEKAETV